MTKLPTVLITDGEQRAALAAVRSLGRSGCRVHVCSARGRSLAGASRYCVRDWAAADPIVAPESFSRTVGEIVDQVAADVVLPATEAAHLALLPRRDGLGAIVPCGSLDAFTALCNKAGVLAAAAALEISVPQQTVIDSYAPASVPRDLRYPVVIKPARSVVTTGAGLVKTTVQYARDPRELESALSTQFTGAFPVMLQERVEGPGIGVSMLIWEGELRAAFAHRRLREKPPSGGVSVLREAIPLDADLLRRSVSLVSSYGWQGVAMVEYKVQSSTGRPYLMEINARLWGSVQLAIDAGVDFPRLLVQAALGVRHPPVTRYAVGTRTRWEWGDVDHLLARMRHSAARLELPATAPSRWDAVLGFLASFSPRNRREVFRFGDPAPFFRESMDWMRRQ
jgi:predicted ATP-grasp superfamily ATP-dependent carboligase